MKKPRIVSTPKQLRPSTWWLFSLGFGWCPPPPPPCGILAWGEEFNHQNHLDLNIFSFVMSCDYTCWATRTHQIHHSPHFGWGCPGTCSCCLRFQTLNHLAPQEVHNVVSTQLSLFAFSTPETPRTTIGTSSLWNLNLRSYNPHFYTLQGGSFWTQHPGHLWPAEPSPDPGPVDCQINGHLMGSVTCTECDGVLSQAMHRVWS